MFEEKLSVWDWLVLRWNSPRWRRRVRLLAAGVLAALGVVFLVTLPGSGDWIPIFLLAVVFLILGLRIEVPEEPLPLSPELREETQTEEITPREKPSGVEAGTAPPEPRKKIGVLAILRLPLAAFAAFCAQWVSEVHPLPIESSQRLGWILFGLAFLLVVWTLLAGDVALALESTRGTGSKPGFDIRRLGFFVCAIFFGLLAYWGFWGGMFRLLPLIMLALAVVYWWIALADYSGGIGETILSAPSAAATRIRAAVNSVRKGVTITGSWTVLVVLCFVGLVVYRTYNIAAVPPEMTSDHIEKLINVADILQGRTYIFFGNNGGREALEFYLIAAVSQILGTGITFLSLKIVSISMGILMLPFLYLLGKELADRRVGLVAMILGGVGYWPDMISRIGLRFPLAMLFSAATLYFFFRALRRRRWNDFLWAGLMLGIGMYGYTSIRIVPVALAVVAGLFLIHPSSKGSRGWAVLGFLVTMATVALLFIPFLRYAVDFPGDFWLRTITRIVPSEGPLQNPVGTFFSNVKNALLMFSWNDGVGWFNCVPLRPALDIVTGGLFALGVFGLAVHTVKKRSWEAASLILLIPVLLLPSIMALAIPNENPHLARASAAIPITFLLPAVALVLLLDYLKGLVPGRNGRYLAALAAAALIFFAARQDFDLTQRQYPAVYRENSQNASEIGTFMLKFYSTIGRPEDAYLIPYPYWVDDRIVNVYAGFPILSHHVINPGDIPGFAFSGRPTVFLLLAQDTDDLHALQEKFPTGYYGTVVSAFPGKDFMFFLVPGTPIAANP
jgi:hypothetical protein